MNDTMQTNEPTVAAAAIPPVWMRPSQAEAVFGLSPQSLLRAADKGSIKRAKTAPGRGGCVLYYAPSIDAWLMGCSLLKRKKYASTNPRGGHGKAKVTA